MLGARRALQRESAPPEHSAKAKRKKQVDEFYLGGVAGQRVGAHAVWVGRGKGAGMRPGCSSEPRIPSVAVMAGAQSDKVAGEQLLATAAGEVREVEVEAWTEGWGSAAVALQAAGLL